MKNYRKPEAILKLIPEDYKKNIKATSLKTSSLDGSNLIIFHLLRDQRLKFKKLVELLENENAKSLYVEFNSKFYHIGGETHIDDNINNVYYKISPICPLDTPQQSMFYKKIKDISPKGTTRNCIIINTHCGLLPLHLSKLFNRLYGIDLKKEESAEAKLNFKINKMNNCLLFTTEINKWLKEFSEYKYTPPGRKHKIGLLLADASLLDKNSCEFIFSIEPETIMLFSRRPDDVTKITDLIQKKANYETTFSESIEGFYIKRIKGNQIVETK